MIKIATPSVKRLEETHQYLVLISEEAATAAKSARIARKKDEIITTAKGTKKIRVNSAIEKANAVAIKASELAVLKTTPTKKAKITISVITTAISGFKPQNRLPKYTPAHNATIIASQTISFFIFSPLFKNNVTFATVFMK